MSKCRLRFLNIIFSGCLCLGLITSCKPYDSDEVNAKLMQGIWLLSSWQMMDKEMIDSQRKDSTTISFSGDQYTHYSDMTGESSPFRYKINAFTLDVLDGDSLVFTQNIVGIWADSLVLGNKDNKWIYKRLE